MIKTMFFSFYLSCYYGIEMPSRAMTLDDIEQFDINTNVHTECSVSPAKYFVKKHSQTNEFEETEYVFYAARYDAVRKNPFSTPDFVRFPTTGADVLGEATCKHGMIDWVNVKKPNRRCGIGKVLSALCMLDPQIHSVGSKNKAYTELKRHNDNMEVVFLHNCLRLVSLYNIANTEDDEEYAGAFAYLKAARHSGLQYLVVHRESIELGEKSKRPKDCHGEFLHPYEVDRILTQNLYDGNTGRIENIEGSGYQATWYFCRR